MACINDLHLDDIGTIIRVTIQDTSETCVTAALDVSTATTTDLIFKKPDGTKVTQTGGFTTDGTDGKIEYTTIANDIDQIGEWKIQVYLVLPIGSWRSDIGYFKVIENL